MLRMSLPVSLTSGTCRLSFICLALLICATFLQAAPVTPTNLRATAISSSSFGLIWDDNSTDETTFLMLYKVNGESTTQTLDLGSVPGIGTRSVSFTGLTGWETVNLRIRAVNGSGNSTSADIDLDFDSFGNPSNAVARVQPDGSVLITWIDNATTEAGYQVERALASGGYTLLGSADANYTGFLDASLAPNTAYRFRVRGYKGSSTYTAYTNVVTATTPSVIAAPSGLTVTGISPFESSVNLAYNDNTGINNGYAYEYRVAGGSDPFVSFGEALDYPGINAPNSLSPGTSFEFRCRAFYNSGTSRAYSAYSNTASFTTPFNAPSALSASVVSESQINLSWTDNSAAEGGVAIYIRLAGTGEYVLYDYSPPNATSYSVGGLFPGTAYEFQVAAAANREGPGTATVVYSARTSAVSGTTKDGFTTPRYIPATLGQAYTYQASTSTASPRTAWLMVTGLPSGLIFDTATGAITGTPSVSGLFTVTLRATFANGWTSSLPLTLRIIRPPTAPVAGTPLPATLQLVKDSAAQTLNLTTAFTDADVESVVRMVTTKGNLDVLLYPNETPITVNNFMGYVNRGDYNDSAFHRISTLEDSGVAVLQGGQLKTSSSSITSFTTIPPQTAVANEPGISNRTYSIAMVKAGGNPNSAAKEFYFNLSDVNTQLDDEEQNGGFTVFGRVSGATQTTLAALALGPAGGPYNITVDGAASTSPFKWPMNVANAQAVPATMDNTKVMKILSVSSLTSGQWLTYSAGSSAPSVATASVSGTSLSITPLAPGNTTITVTATDLDGLTSTQIINVSVKTTFAQWATSAGLTGNNADFDDDADFDGRTNLEEYALMTSAVNPGESSAPAFTTTGTNTKYGEITFSVRKFAPGLTYTVQGSSTLESGGWTNLWTLTDGFSASSVTSAVSQSDRTIITVRDNQAVPPAVRRFLRVVVTASE